MGNESAWNVDEVIQMQERKRPMPVGIEDFKKLVQGEYYFVFNEETV